MHNVNLAKLLKTLRLSAGLTQVELADKVEISKQSLSLLEAGKRQLSLERASEMADALGHDLIVEVLPRDAVVPLSLFRELSKLGEKDQQWLAEIAAVLPELEEHQRDAVIELAKVFAR